LQRTLLEYLGLSEVFGPEPKEEVVDDLLSVVELPGLGRAFKCRVCNALFVSLGDFERHRTSPDPDCRGKRVELFGRRIRDWAVVRAAGAVGALLGSVSDVVYVKCPRCRNGVVVRTWEDGETAVVEFSCWCGWTAKFACSLADFWREGLGGLGR
jgi:phage FluMu protein Com